MANDASFGILHGGHTLAIHYHSDEVVDLLDFLFQDVVGQVAAPSSELRITSAGGGWRLESRSAAIRSQASSLMELASPLMHAVLLQLALSDPERIHLHAAAVSDDRGTILLPGSPGSGKTTVCLALCREGYRYHSDEFVSMAPSDHDTAAFTRPLMLRRAYFDRLCSEAGWKRTGSPEAIRVGARNVWIPHREINPDYRYDAPPLRAIVFPHFDSGQAAAVSSFSPAKAGMQMMQSQFKSGAHEDHGFAAITALVRSLPVYLMTFQHPGQIPGLMGTI